MMFIRQEGLAQYFSQFVDARTFCVLRSAGRPIHRLLHADHECYYFARVKYISRYRLKPTMTALTTYKEIFQQISLLAMQDDIYSTICSSEELVELVFKTPLLLDKLFCCSYGAAHIIGFLRIYPSLHRYVFQDILIARQFKESEEYWASSFIHLIYSDAGIFTGLLRSDEMILSLAFGCRPESHDHLTLCKYLKEKYNAGEEEIAAVLKLKTPRIEVDLQTQERRAAIFSLLKSLRASEDNNDPQANANSPPPSRFFRP